MSVEELQQLEEMLFVQSKITTIILAFTAFILAGVFFDLLFHLFKKYIKKDEKNEKGSV